MSEYTEHLIRMDVETAKYWYGRFHEYLEKNPDEVDILTFSNYLGNVVLYSMKSIFEGKVPEIYNPVTEEHS